MKRQHLVIIAVVAVVLLLIGGGVLAYALSQGGALPGFGKPTPPAVDWGNPGVKVTPPASLEEIAKKVEADYPQLAELLRDPKLGSVYKDFYLAYQQGGKDTAVALAKQRGILNSKNEIEMTLVLDTEDTAALMKELEAEKVVVKGGYKNKIDIAIPVSLIEEQINAKNPDLIVKRISNLNHVVRLEFTQKAGPQKGIIQGQGVNVTYAANWHAQGITGKGVKVGVLDLGFGGYKKLLGSELPKNVTAKAFGDDSEFDQEVHGTACAEIIHEMAPDAEIYLAYYGGSDVAMGQAIDWLVSQNVDIISNSTGSNGLSPLDGSGFSAALADMAHDQGIFFVSAAGNEADVHWRGQFKDTDGNNIHEFFPGKETLPFIPGGPGFTTKIIMNWNDWQTVDQDYNLLLADKEGNLLATSGDMQNGESGQLPLEAFINEFENDNVYLLAIENVGGKARGDAVIDIFIMGGAMHPDYQVPGYSLTNPADARGAFTIGAVNWSNDVLEPYSSQGPTEDDRLKPDLSAPSVVDSASYSPEAFNGTSAATPHVAGAAALVLQAFPKFKPDDIAKFLKERSIDLGDPGPDNVFGVGRLSLGAAPDKAGKPETTPPPPPDVQLEPTSTPVPVAEGQPGQPGLGGKPGGDTGIGGQPGGQSGAPGQTKDSGLVGTLVLLGLCMTCLAGLLFILIVVAFLIMRRRK